MGRNVIIFGADMSLSVQYDDNNKSILILGERPTQGLDDTQLTAEAKYSVNFTQSGKRFVLSLHYNGSNSFLFVNAIKIYQFRVKDSEVKNYTLCLGNVKGSVKIFSVDFNPIDINDIFEIHKYLMQKNII